MDLDPLIWSKLHGAATHFPIALMLVSALCDGLSLVPRATARQQDFRFAATITLLLGALASYAAVASGLIMARGQVWGHATMLRHHLFAWPAFALMTGLAAWRLAIFRHKAPRPSAMYLVLTLLAVMFVSGAGYWGGELLNEG